MLKTTVAMKIGKIVRLKIIEVNPNSPITHLNASNFLSSTGTSLITCLPKILELTVATLN